MSCDFTKSMAISLKRLEIAKVVDLKTWSVLNGFKSFASSAWLRLCDEEKELRDELAELEMSKEQPKEKCRCYFGCPHVCKDGEALLSNGAICPCSCHKPKETQTVATCQGCGGKYPCIDCAAEFVQKMNKEQPKLTRFNEICYKVKGLDELYRKKEDGHCLPHEDTSGEKGHVHWCTRCGHGKCKCETGLCRCGVLIQNGRDYYLKSEIDVMLDKLRSYCNCK